MELFLLFGIRLLPGDKVNTIKRDTALALVILEQKKTESHSRYDSVFELIE